MPINAIPRYICAKPPTYYYRPAVVHFQAQFDGWFERKLGIFNSNLEQVMKKLLIIRWCELVMIHVWPTSKLSYPCFIVDLKSKVS